MENPEDFLSGYVIGEKPPPLKQKERRSTREVVTSYGVISFIETKEGPRFLLHQRRDTFEYIEFVRGLWTEKTIGRIFRGMTEDERDRVRDYTYRELWDDMWTDHRAKGYQSGFKKGKRKYDKIAHRLLYILQNTAGVSKTPGWGFPKGKKQGMETEFQCAVREFEEEVRIRLPIHCQPIGPKFTEHFIGSDDVKYSTVYFLVQMPTAITPKFLKFKGRIRKESISFEVGDVRWVTFKQAKELLIPRMQEILALVLSFVRS